MSFKHAVLGALAEGPLHGYAVRTAIDREIGRFWPVSQGQVYATLERLERNGLVGSEVPSEREPGTPGRTYSLLGPGRQALCAWLSDLGGHDPGDGLGFDDWLAHLVVSDRWHDAKGIGEAVAVQRRRCLTLRHALEQRTSCSRDTVPTRTAYELLAAELEWLDTVEQELLANPPGADNA